MTSRAFLVLALAAAAAGASFVAACSSDDVDNTVYQPPDSGPVTTYYCIRDLDCQEDGGTQVCGFSIAEGCASRGVCVDIVGGAQKCDTSNQTYCGCAGGEATVTSCALAQKGYVRGGPTDGTQAVREDDGGFTCR